MINLIFCLSFIIHGSMNKPTEDSLPQNEQTNKSFITSNSDLLEEKYGNLKHLSVILRHGTRTPDPDSLTYPQDPHRNFWSKGQGVLTNDGKKQIFDLGQWYRQRYYKITGGSYRTEQILVHSSEVDRNIMSALCFLHGFYLIDDLNRWKEGENWQPVPVHTIPRKDNNILLPSRICPRIRQRKRAVYYTQEGQKIYGEYKEILRYTETNSGIPFSSMDINEQFIQLRHLKTILLIQSKNNLSLPDWTSKIYPQPLQIIEEKTIKLEASDQTWKRLSGGPLLQNIISDMEKKASDPKFEQVLHVYVGHEKTIESYLSVFNLSGIKNGTRAYFGSSIMIELRQKNNQFFVMMSYLWSIQDTFVYLNIPKCGISCSLEMFLKLYKPFILEDWQRECTIKSGSVGLNISNLLLMVCGLMGLIK